MPAEKIHYAVECTADGCLVEFHMNDFPVVRRGTGRGYFHGTPVNELVVSGANSLTLVIGPGERPGTALTGEAEERGTTEIAEGAFAQFRLGEYPEGAMIGGPDCRELAVIEWKPDRDVSVTVPMVRSTTLMIDPPFGPWSWEQLPPLVLDEPTLAELREYVGQLHLAVDSGMAEPYFEACAVRFAEVEAAHHLEPGDRLDTAKQLFSTFMGRDTWALVPLEEIEWDPRLVAEGRLVELCATDGKAILRQLPQEGSSVAFLDMRVGRVDGEWKALR